SCAEYQIPSELSLVELGLDSLKMVELKHRTDALLGIDLPLSILLADDSLNDLAKRISAVPPADALPAPGAGTNLSHTQKAPWAVHGLDDASVSYNLHLALDIAGELDMARLRAVLALVMERHDQLRTVYRVESSSIVQSGGPLAKLPEWFEIVDASGWDTGSISSEAHHCALQLTAARRIIRRSSFARTTSPLMAGRL